MTEYIERDAAVKAAQDGADEWDGGYNRNRDMYIEAAIDKLSAADVKPIVRGKWEVNHYPVAECQVCKHLIDISHLISINFCPNCGADMRGDDDG